jgi:hypothetical protein
VTTAEKRPSAYVGNAPGESLNPANWLRRGKWQKGARAKLIEKFEIVLDDFRNNTCPLPIAGFVGPLLESEQQYSA